MAFASFAVAGCGDDGGGGSTTSSSTGGTEAGSSDVNGSGGAGTTATTDATGGSSDSSGGSSSSAVCLGTVTSGCDNELCDQMPGCTVTEAAVCSGDAAACSNFDDDTSGCAAQWGCGMGPTGLCRRYDMTCSDLSNSTDCASVAGCWWGSLYCNGDITANCVAPTTQASCTASLACYWTAATVAYCQGQATDCSAMTSETCEMQSGCTLTPATCSGTPTACEALSTDNCLLQPGCRLASGGTRAITPTTYSAYGVDLVFASFSAARSSYAGTPTLAVQFEELNRANVQSVAHTNRIYLSTDNVFDDTDITYAEFEVTDPLLPYGLNTESLDVELTMPTSDELAAGEYYVLVVLDDGNVSAELDETNNVAVTAEPVYIGPDVYDLAAVSVTHSATGTLAPDDSLELTLSLQNQSTLAVSEAAVGVYFSTDQTLDDGDIPVSCTSPLTLELAVGASADYAVSCTAPRARGTYYVLAEIDPEDVLTDIDRSNNVAVSSATVAIDADSPDLTVTELTSDSYSIDWQGSVTLTATVANTGADPSPVTTVGFYASGTLALCSASVDALAAGASITVSKECTLDASTYGTLPLSAYVDPTDAVYEADETNNTFSSSTSLTVAEPDINLIAAGVGLVAGGAERKVGEDLDVYYELQNDGTDDSPAFRVIIYASSDATIDSSDTEFCILDINSGITASSTTTSGLYQTCPVVTLEPAEYYIGMVVDTDDVIPETDESDNVAVDSVNKLTVVSE